MSIWNEDTFTPIKELAGKTVKMAVRAIDSSGYQYVAIEFTDGSSTKVEEAGQVGHIIYSFGREGCDIAVHLSEWTD